MKAKTIENFMVELDQISTSLSNLAELIGKGTPVDAQVIILSHCNHIDRIVDDLNSYEQ